MRKERMSSKPLHTRLLSGIFPDDNGLLLRMAFVEKLFGEEPDTFTVKKNIWFMSSAGVDVTKNASFNPLYTKIKQQFGIEWSQIVFADLSKPFIAGIEVSLYLSLHQPVTLYRGNSQPLKYLADIMKTCSSVLGYSYIMTKTEELLIRDKLSPEVLISRSGLQERLHYCMQR